MYATPGGDLEAREYLRPVWTRSSGGAWKRVDTDLAVTDGGLVAPEASTVGLEFSGGGDEAPLVRLERAGRELTLSWPTALPEPVLSGAVATYPSVLPGVDLRMTAQEDGFGQLLVVKTAEAAANPELAELRLRLSTQGLDVQETEDGGLEALDKGAQGVVFEAPRPMMWDSSPGEETPTAAPKTLSREGTESADAPGPEAAETGAADIGDGGEPGAGESGKLAPVSVDIPAEQDELVLTPDAEVLRGQDTTYPVYIDPQWYSPQATAWTMASKYWASSPQWKFNGDSDSGMGYCNWNYCEPNDTKRLFYRIPVSAFAGRSILSAEFVVRETWAASCSAREVELWQTKGISSSTTWNSQTASGFWIKQRASASFAYGYTGCAARDAEFDVRSAVQTAANNKASTMTFGLRAGSESDGYAWKRFSDKAYLRVKYNRPPAQLKSSQLTMEYGGACKNSSAPARVRSLGKIYANSVTDPDGDAVSVQFEASWDGGKWSPARTSAKASGSTFAISLPSTIPQNKTVSWYARVYDGAQYSPWSYAGDPQACYFVYDASVPKAPVISSGDYPVSDPEDPSDPWYDGVGRYGSFQVAGADTDVTTYWYGINGDPTSQNKITTSSGGARFVNVLPATPGLNFFTAQAFDAVGNASEIRTYQYRVKPGQPERATWQLDEGAGAAEAQGSTPARTLDLHGGVTPGVQGVENTAVAFNGTDGYASTDLSPVNTAGGFAISAWVKLDEIPTHTAEVALVAGNNAPGLELYYSTTYGWSFAQYKSDNTSGGLVRATQGDIGLVQAGVWTHLTGSYSSTDDLLEMYVNGQLVDSVAYSTPWEARRGLQVGARNIMGTPGLFFPGTIDSLQLFDKPLTAGEVSRLHDHLAVGDPGRPAIAVFTMDESPDATTLTGHGGVFPAKYHGTVTTGVAGVAAKAAHFDGSTGYARIGDVRAPHVNTQRSFTVSAWAKLDRKPTGAAVITAQTGTVKPGLELYYSAGFDRWVVNQYTGDTTDATPIRAMQPDGVSARIGEWVHLVGVHDTVANTLTLYVNGVKAGSTTLVSSFYADQSMYIGASNYSGAMGSYFPGTIDDVRLLDRPVSADEVRQMFRQRPLVTSRWTFETASTATPPVTADAGPSGADLSLYNGAAIGSGWVDGGLALDGVDDYAGTASGTVPVDTSASFTVSAFAQTAGIPTGEVALLSTPGTNKDAFSVRYVPSATPETDGGRWRLTTSDADSSTAGSAQVENGRFFSPEDWTHLALVYDGFAHELRLYVNGELEEVACTDTDGDGVPDVPDCTERVSYAGNVITFRAVQSLLVGRDRAGAYFPGSVSDVWTFQGVLDDLQIEHLAIGMPGVPTEVPGND